MGRGQYHNNYKTTKSGKINSMDGNRKKNGNGKMKMEKMGMEKMGMRKMGMEKILGSTVCAGVKSFRGRLEKIIKAKWGHIEQ